jgi:hypothetical protein
LYIRKVILTKKERARKFNLRDNHVNDDELCKSDRI